VAAGDIARAARTFARAERAGATAGTGPNMSGHGNLVEYLLLCLTSACGHWRRAGEALPNPGALLAPARAIAQAEAPRRAFGYGPKLRVRGLGNSAAGLPTAALASEILTEGEGRVRALFCIGSNPVAAWPDQLEAIEAVSKLDLLVCLDTRLGATARHADYVIAPTLGFEVPGYTLFLENLEQTYAAMGIAAPYAQYAPALVEPPAGSDVIEEWRFFFRLAKRMGQKLTLYPVRSEAGPRRSDRAPIEVDLSREPSSDEVLAWLAQGSRVPLEDVKRHPHGAIFGGEVARVAPKDPNASARLELGDPAMLGELAALRAEPLGDPSNRRYPFRLISRRLPNVYNSSGRDLPAHRNKRSHNPAFLHPDDLAALGVEDGELIEIRSERALILGVAESAPELRRGVVSMAHAFGDAPERDALVREIGSCTGRLVASDRDFDPHTGIPRMSAIPVALARVAARPTPRPEENA
jgi:anaerobic selenocysteine-containing dehydrogenase